MIELKPGQVWKTVIAGEEEFYQIPDGYALFSAAAKGMFDFVFTVLSDNGLTLRDAEPTERPAKQPEPAAEPEQPAESDSTNPPNPGPAKPKRPDIGSGIS